MSLVGLIALPWILLTNVGVFPGFDTYAYYTVNLSHPYTGSYIDLGAFRYTPVAAQLAYPLRFLPWELLVGLWMAAMLAVLVWFGGKWAIAFLAFPPVAIELYHGNVNLFMAAAVVGAFRWPALYAFPILTKVTPGVAVLWFAGRQEWRKLAIALAVSAGIALISFVVAPDLWRQWLQSMIDSIASPLDRPFPTDIPMTIRAPAAVAIALYGGHRDWRWTAAVAAFLGLPVIWWGGLSMLAGVVPLLRDDIRRGTVTPPRALVRWFTGRDELRDASPDAGSGLSPT